MVPAHTINIDNAKTQLSRLTALVESGEKVTISRNGRPVARLVPYSAARSPRAPGAWSGKVTIASDFDAHSDDADAAWYNS